MRERNEFERKLAHALECQFGAFWFLKGADQSDLGDYARARDDNDRAAVRRVMENQTLVLATNCAQAMVAAGFAQLVTEA